MRYGFYIGTCLFLIIVQTTLLTYFNVFAGMYDLLIPFVIFISICLPLRESLPFILILGLIMDNLSGSPFGLYLTFYFWLFVGVRWILKFLRVSNKFLLSLVVVGAVLIQNMLIIGTFGFVGAGLATSGSRFQKYCPAVFLGFDDRPAVFILPVSDIQTL